MVLKVLNGPLEAVCVRDGKRFKTSFYQIEQNNKVLCDEHRKDGEGHVSGEPVVIDNVSIETRLGKTHG